MGELISQWRQALAKPRRALYEHTVDTSLSAMQRIQGFGNLIELLNVGLFGQEGLHGLPSPNNLRPDYRDFHSNQSPIKYTLE